MIVPLPYEPSTPGLRLLVFGMQSSAITVNAISFLRPIGDKLHERRVFPHLTPVIVALIPG